ncbi:GNAT family N-acetyltransferase [Lentzea guizhouensis]|uniref:GNAT family N-acetyltransferase n=1 Tax=Lentzea guizhouensis TaxID=1586287 RepID=A0A1B2HQS1_9PSEU|nr:GNAT family N-acetyltransferase [Lentzea guizhouensis]ANZ40080.1 GNAT family N-acetyltransferase [Lentzea guizhouensis]
MPEVTLREIEESDLDALFEFMRDPESVRMAAFTAADPDDRAAFDAHMRKVLGRTDVTNRAVLADGRFVGTVASFVVEGDLEVTYWIDRGTWGQGVASAALRLLLEVVPDRPVYGRVASDNAGSRRVLEKAGFEVVGTDAGFANGRQGEVEETIMRLS